MYPNQGSWAPQEEQRYYNSQTPQFDPRRSVYYNYNPAGWSPGYEHHNPQYWPQRANSEAANWNQGPYTDQHYIADYGRPYVPHQPSTSGYYEPCDNRSYYEKLSSIGQVMYDRHRVLGTGPGTQGSYPGVYAAQRVMERENVDHTRDHASTAMYMDVLNRKMYVEEALNRHIPIGENISLDASLCQGLLFEDLNGNNNPQLTESRMYGTIDLNAGGQRLNLANFGAIGLNQPEVQVDHPPPPPPYPYHNNNVPVTSNARAIEEAGNEVKKAQQALVEVQQRRTKAQEAVLNQVRSGQRKLKNQRMSQHQRNAYMKYQYSGRKTRSTSTLENTSETLEDLILRMELSEAMQEEAAAMERAKSASDKLLKARREAPRPPHHRTSGVGPAAPNRRAYRNTRNSRGYSTNHFQGNQRGSQMFGATPAASYTPQAAPYTTRSGVRGDNNYGFQQNYKPHFGTAQPAPVSSAQASSQANFSQTASSSYQGNSRHRASKGRQIYQPYSGPSLPDSGRSTYTGNKHQRNQPGRSTMKNQPRVSSRTQYDPSNPRKSSRITAESSSTFSSPSANLPNYSGVNTRQSANKKPLNPSQGQSSKVTDQTLGFQSQAADANQQQFSFHEVPTEQNQQIPQPILPIQGLNSTTSAYDENQQQINSQEQSFKEVQPHRYSTRANSRYTEQNQSSEQDSGISDLDFLTPSRRSFQASSRMPCLDDLVDSEDTVWW